MRVSVAGLGCGGPSRLGLRQNKSDQEAVALIREAVDSGVNLLDTAEAYETEPVVGRAIEVFPRDRLVISTKKSLPPKDHPDPDAEIRKGLEQSLKALRTDYIDVYHLHGVEPQDYAYARDRLLPSLARLREQGKIGWIGITEGFVPDPSHRMLQRALRDDHWDAVMVGFNLLNPSARKTVLPKAIERDVGVLNMFAVRRALSRPQRFADTVNNLHSRGMLGVDDESPEKLAELLMRMAGASALPEVAYRFCRHEPGVHVVLTGTGSPDHLRSNLESLAKPPLPQLVSDRLRALFGAVDSVTGN